MKNKKLALSVLSTAVVSSLAASAFAATPTGLYIGGSVDRYYSLESFVENKNQALADIGTAGYANVVYVHADGRVAVMDEVIENGNLFNSLRQAQAGDFENDGYTTINPDGSNGQVLYPDLDVEPGELKVESVSAINAAELTIKFGAAVDASTATDPDYYLIDGQTLTALGLTSNELKLSADGKTLTIDLSSIPLTNNTTYRIQVTNDITDKAGNKIEAYDKLFTFKDTTAPTVVSTNYSAATSTFTIKFSEPLAANAASKVKVLDKNNNDVTGSRVNISGDQKSIIVDAAAAPALIANETYRVVILGATDLVGNYFANNKVEASFKVAKIEEVKPTVASLVAKDVKTVRVTFSEPIFVDTANGDKIAELDVDDSGTLTNVVKVTTPTGAVGEAVDVNGDGKTWDITVDATGLTGVHKVTLVNFQDLQGNVQDTAYNKFVTFSADQTAPALVNSSTAGTKLYLTFDEDVTLDDTNPVTVLTPDNVEVDVALTSGTTLKYYGTDTKTVVIDLGTTVVSKAGSYKVTIPAGMIKDAGNNTMQYTVTKSFTPGDTTKPTLLLDVNGDIDPSAIVQTSGKPSEIKIKFSEKVDSSALNVANYKVNGQQVFTSAVFSGDTDTVKLTVAPGSIEVDGTYVFTISNIKDLAGNVMDTVTAEEDLVENVAPVLSKAELTKADEITLTFSEAVFSDDDTDFEVYVDGAKVGFSYASGVITLDNPIADPEKPIVVKILSTSDIKDSNGNVIVGNVTKDVVVNN